MNTQNIALDSCVVIDIMEKPHSASGLKARLRGKSAKIILCDVVLDEVRRVRGYSSQEIISKVTALLGRKVEVSESDKDIISNADQITNQFQICHNGDNKILSLCQAKDFVLVTSDRMLLKASQFIGVAAFHTSMVGGI